VSVFEFVITLYSIVIALGIARLLGGYVALIEFREKIAHRPLFVLWLSLLLFGHVVWWFNLWSRSDTTTFSLFQTVFTFHVPAFLFIACHLLVPSEGARETMAERYAKLRVPFLVCLAIPFIPAPLLAGIATGDWSVASYLIPIGGLLLLGTASANLRFQYLIASAATVVYLVFAVNFRSGVG
jgi:fucose 4-O-acetylase-like acetyltransferase